MPRQRGPARSAPSRPAPAPARPTAAPQRPAAYTSASSSSTQQRRPTSTATPTAAHNTPIPHPPGAAPHHHQQHQHQQHAPVQQGSSPGLFGQMASTAAGVAVGSSIGHAVGNWFTGGSSSEQPAPAAPPAPADQSASPQTASAQPMDAGLYQSNAWGAATENTAGVPCENDVKSFRRCMDEHEGNMSICGWYLDQLKACQAAAKNY